MLVSTSEVFQLMSSNSDSPMLPLPAWNALAISFFGGLSFQIVLTMMWQQAGEIARNERESTLRDNSNHTRNEADPVPITTL